MMIRAIHALVQIGSVETPYLRGGCGAPVLLLRSLAYADGSGRTREEDAVFQALAQTFRVISPLVPPPGVKSEGERWLRDVIDGLGLDRPAVVADAALAPLLFRFAFRDRGRIGTVVILPEEEAAGRHAVAPEALLGALSPAKALPPTEPVPPAEPSHPAEPSQPAGST